MSFIPSIYLFILFIHLSSIHPFITWSIHPFVHLFISPSNNESFNKKCYQMNYKISVYAEKSPQMMIKTLLWQMKATESILIKKKVTLEFNILFVSLFVFTTPFHRERVAPTPVCSGHEDGLCDQCHLLYGLRPACHAEVSVSRLCRPLWSHAADWWR